jgi:hypothetical protein
MDNEANAVRASAHLDVETRKRLAKNICHGLLKEGCQVCGVDVLTAALGGAISALRPEIRAQVLELALDALERNVAIGSAAVDNMARPH